MTDAPTNQTVTSQAAFAHMLGDPALRGRAEEAAHEMLRDLIGKDYSDTTLRVATDHILSFARISIRNGPSIDAARGSTSRLIDVAKSDTNQARRVADFLLAWWNGADLGLFDITDVFALDRVVAADIATVVGFLGQSASAIYPDALGFRDDIEEIIMRWRKLVPPSA